MLRRLFVVLTAAIALKLNGAAGVAQQSATTVIHVGSVLADDLTPVYYAQQMGWFKREGLEVQVIGGNSGTAMTAAVISGSYEFGKSSLLSAINAHLRGLPLEVIASGPVYESKNPFGELCVASDSAISTGKDFEGKTFGSPALNGLTDLGMRAWVDAHGGDPKAMKFVELSSTTAAAAIAQHRVDAAILNQPFLAQAVAAKEVKRIAPALDAIAKSFVMAAYFTSSDYAKAHPDIVAKFAKILYAASAYTNKHHAETAAMISEIASTPVTVVEHMPRVDGAVGLNPAQYQPVIDAAAKFNMIPHAFPAREMLLNAPGLLAQK